MSFTDKYISTSENLAKADPAKTILSNDAFAIGEMIDTLTKKIMELSRK